MIDDLDKKIIEDLGIGLSSEQISRKYGVSKATISKRIKQMKEQGIDIPKSQNIRKIKEDEINNQILDRLEKDETIKQIAIELGLTVHSVSNRIKKLKSQGIYFSSYKKNRSNKIYNEILVRLGKGETLIQIAKELGVSTSSISNKIKKMKEQGIEIPGNQNKKNQNDETDKKIIIGLAEGKTQTEIAIELNITPQRVSQRIKKMKEKGIEIPYIRERKERKDKNTNKKENDEIDNKILECFAEGKTQKRISKELGLSEWAISRRIRKMRERGVKIYKNTIKEIPDEEIYSLREEGLTYSRITNFFKNKGLKVSEAEIRKRCKKIYKEKGKEEPVMDKHVKIEISDEEIFNLREQGLTYKEITEILNKKGIKVSCSSIGKRCKKIYQEKGKQEPAIKRKSKKSEIEISNEEIYGLREQRYTYQEISNYFKNKGINISAKTIQKICKKTYQEKGQEEPVLGVKARKIKISDEEIYNLREQGLSYNEIKEYYEYKGIEVSYSTIAARCKKIYEEKGKQDPNVKKRTRKEEIKIPDEELYNLREQGLTYKEIAKIFNKKGIKVSYSTIRTRCKKTYIEKRKEEPNIKRKKAMQKTS